MMDAWQKQQREAREKERQRQQESAHNLQQYRATGLSPAERKEKEEKEKERRRQQESAQSLQQYRAQGLSPAEKQILQAKEEDRHQQQQATNLLHSFVKTVEPGAKPRPYQRHGAPNNEAEIVTNSTGSVAERAHQLEAATKTATNAPTSDDPQESEDHLSLSDVSGTLNAAASDTVTSVPAPQSESQKSSSETAARPAEASTDPDSMNTFVQDLKDGAAVKGQLEDFVVLHAAQQRPVAVITSGGTAADLEGNSVRSLENFSTGMRGAVSVEEFLKRGYAVVHLQRTGSAAPYARAIEQHLGTGLSTVEAVGKLFAIPGENEEDDLVENVVQQQDDPWLSQSTEEMAESEPMSNGKHQNGSSTLSLHRGLAFSTHIQRLLRERSEALQEGRLLTIRFRSVEEYLGKLELCATILAECNALVLFFLAAAVSDFYIPSSERSEHKLQSSGGNLSLQLSPVPKVMGVLRSTWAPQSFVVSFKLETDHQLLRQKANRAVEKYGCHMVIGNLLHTRHQKVWILKPPGYQTESKDAQNWSFDEIFRPSTSRIESLESAIVDAVVQAHFEFISWTLSAKGAGMDSAKRAQTRLQQRKRDKHREAFWRRAKGIILELAGALLAAGISWSISTALQRRLQK